MLTGNLTQKRNEVIALYDKGDTAKAKQVLLEELDPLSDHVNDICEEFIEYIEHYIDTATARAARGTGRLMWLVIGLRGLDDYFGIGTVVVVHLRRSRSSAEDCGGRPAIRRCGRCRRKPSAG